MSDPGQRFTEAPIVPRHRAYAEIFNVRGRYPQSFVLTSGSLTGLNTHWFDNRPQPCVGMPSCRHCRAGLNIRWKAYISALSWPKRCHGLLHVTEFAAEQLLALVSPGMSFRGIAVSLCKANESKQAKVLVKRHTVELDCTIPIGFDPVPVIQRLYNVSFVFRRYTMGEMIVLPEVTATEMTSSNGEEVK